MSIHNICDDHSSVVQAASFQSIQSRNNNI
ncbi:hypothetical protein PPL_03669 [Heterostelium album PN500]|uniref:Uncharacterized protein n=1 Tax=Heterostelium pallidum (strain ATCC 26659 / Pp 5 / PN500) TaxID=670386 RepID=D3B6C1_HETP5|nr:hypothetical protein PPL_03669 [Heterostelium album PN500]EFA82891.1 hypothetical protein PPL_03669 [Heterostelium album PN500]|eukprot:XP_020435008.1 hypothetical protein PPL_03669 [Heterostelium album PN500]